MKFETLMECAKILNTVDIDDPKNQKAISVSESYIMHSYDLYKKNCIKEGYEPISKEQYMLEVLNLNEGILKKVLGAAAVAGTAYAAAKGVNYVNQQAKFNTQNTNDQGQGSNGYQSGGGFQGFVNNAKAAYNQAGGVGNLVKNAAATGFGRVGQEQIANQHNVNTEYTDSEGNTQQRQTYTVGSRKDAKKVVKQQDKNSTTSEYTGTPATATNDGNSSNNNNNNNGNQNGQTNQQNGNNQQQTNTQGNTQQNNQQPVKQSGPTEEEKARSAESAKQKYGEEDTAAQPEKQGIGSKVREIGGKIKTGVTGFVKSNFTKEGKEEKRNKANAAAAFERDPNQDPSTIPDPKIRAEYEALQKAKGIKPGQSNQNGQGNAQNGQSNQNAQNGNQQTPAPTQTGTQNDPKKIEVPDQFKGKLTPAQYGNYTRLEEMAKNGQLTVPADIDMYNRLRQSVGQPAYQKPQQTQSAPQGGNQQNGTPNSNQPVNNNNNNQTSSNPITVKTTKSQFGKNFSTYSPEQLKQFGINGDGTFTINFDGGKKGQKGKSATIEVKNGKIVKYMHENYWWFDELPISARKSFLEAQNIHANEYFVAHGVKYKVNEYGNNWNRLSESNIFLEYLDLNNDDELISFAKARHSKVDYQSGKIDDIDFLQEAYQWDMISKDEYIEFMEMYSHSDEFYSVINYICENWYDTKTLREPLTPSMRMPAGYKY